MAKVNQERKNSFLDLDEDSEDLILGDMKGNHDILQDSHDEDDLMLELEEFVNS